MTERNMQPLSQDCEDAAKQLLLDQPGIGAVVRELGGGLSDSKVYELDSGLVLKVQKDRREYAFYSEIVPTYFSDKRWLPKMHYTGESDGHNYVVMEKLDAPWPRARFNVDSEALTILKELHASDAVVTNPTDQTWKSSQLPFAEKYLSTQAMGQVEQLFECYEARRPFNKVICSGDPNAPNWMLRRDGSCVLFDWQLVTMDNRALDLAGWIGTFPEFEEINRMAEVYLGSASRDEVHELAKDIAIFFTRRCATNFWRAEIAHNPEQWVDAVKYLQEVFTGWLEQIVKDVL